MVIITGGRIGPHLVGRGLSIHSLGSSRNLPLPTMGRGRLRDEPNVCLRKPDKGVQDETPSFSAVKISCRAHLKR